ncbi:G/U mismatch-specific uracil-DNA glycosylase [Paenibacillus sp. UNCCL117]|uniref:DNA-deoxyinosine glycosylase n=1 Tax=unclassified Paenibacillus TaxID=185978 RepID=UPI00088079A3|nr:MULTISPECIES: DNA-deoxyinosine glycosylase [unclassified Paenibacillus]SDD15467.1 hypoxanthine-DNA glycosylase [Paenibacillus sp. cl123]SFW34462.1 G/U mismatch-specific uracil-DNA glycosylase [Paenibacillus sp. UNCCL117]
MPGSGDISASDSFKVSFGPEIDDNSRLLILGSMPGEASLRAGRYYGHPRNIFWRLLYALLDGGEPAAAYEDRLRFALSRGIALWDVLRSCERKGSLDSAIRRPEVQDFAGLFERYPRVSYVYFNGSAAAELYRKHVRFAGPEPEGGRVYRTLPSSSPARAMSFEAKLAAWGCLREDWIASRSGGSG